MPSLVINPNLCFIEQCNIPLAFFPFKLNNTKAKLLFLVLKKRKISDVLKIVRHSVCSFPTWQEQLFMTKNYGRGCEIIYLEIRHLGKITIKTPNPKYRLYCWLIELIDWRYTCRKVPLQVKLTLHSISLIFLHWKLPYLVVPRVQETSARFLWRRGAAASSTPDSSFSHKSKKLY